MKVRTFFISDLHFNHEKIFEFEPKRAQLYKTIEDMNEKIIRTWNHWIGPHDIVYVIGDVGFNKSNKLIEYCQRLNGRKILIRGNHDKRSVGMYLKAGFVAVLDQAIINLTKDIRVKLSHFPYSDPGFRVFPNMPVPEKDLWLVHGHVHSKYLINRPEKTINVSWDVWFRPVLKDEILKFIREDENENT